MIIIYEFSTRFALDLEFHFLLLPLSSTLPLQRCGSGNAASEDMAAGG
jgi:hypothetical protein